MKREWAGCKDAADYLGVSRDYIEDRATPWPAPAVLGLVRFRLLRSGPGKKPRRRYGMEDVRALLFDPPRAHAPRIEFGPRFHQGRKVTVPPRASGRGASNNCFYIPGEAQPGELKETSKTNRIKYEKNKQTAQTGAKTGTQPDR